MMTILKHRRSLRLSGYDYSQSGAYFVTICVNKRQSLLGNIINNQMQLNHYGKIAHTSWTYLAQAYPYVELDEWVIMPNHLHGIIIISADCTGGSRTAPTSETKIKPLGRLVGAFKTISTKQINFTRKTSGASFWQRNFYEHIIRDEHSLNCIREYIITNPWQWDLDLENPQAQGRDAFDSWIATFNKSSTHTIICRGGS